MQAKAQDEVDLRGHLVRPAKMVRIILGEAAHTHQSVQHARAFVAIDCALLGIADGQVPVGTHRTFVNLDVEGAVHRLDIVFLILDHNGGIHIFLIEAQVPAGFPERRAPDMRGIDKVIAVGDVLIIPIALNLVTDHGAVGMPEDQPLPNFVILAVKVQLLAQLAMVALASFFHLPEVLI